MSTNEPAGIEGLSPLKRAIVEIRALKERIAEIECGRREPIAVIGMGLRLPGGATTPEAFWQLLANGVDTVSPIPADRWDVNAYFDEDPEAPGRMYTRHGAFLDGIDHFAAGFFGISPRESAQMDPQQRLLLQVAWEALEHAGQAPDRLDGSSTGVFLGICNSDYFRMLVADQSQIDVYLATGTAPSVAAGRISYLLGLQGPSVAIDTACSSSLVAIHMACQSLRSRESNLALAGGVNLILSPEINIAFSKAGMMAPDGHCKTFDAAADGYVRGEGCAVVVLKRLADALADGDCVLAVISGTAVNQDGRSGGLTAPSGRSQEAVIRSALADAGRQPTDVSYVEAHGTGTSLGDPIEVQALGAALRSKGRADQPLVIGSVKTNLGHLEAAAGIAGLIKAVLMLQYGQIAPHLHFTTPSPHIPWEQLGVHVPITLQPWEVQGPRVAGVSSFGFSGTNAHVIVEEAPAPQPAVSDVERPLHLLALSAKSSAALRDMAGRYAQHLDAHPDQRLADVAYTANSGRAHFDHRLALVAGDLAALRDQLAAFARGEAVNGVTGHTVAGATPELAFLFTGHGSHYVGMGQSLYTGQPVFRAAIDRCDNLLRGLIDRTLPEILFGGEGLLDRMDYAQPALFALQYALAELWQSWGVRPSLVAGHSAGEYVAAVVAGVLSLEDGLRLIAARGRLMQSLPADGEMVAIFADEARVARSLAPYAEAVGIAAVNGPATTVISGRRDAVQAVLADLQLDPDDYRRLDVSVAAHSPLIEPILAEFERIVAGVKLAPPQISLVSSMTGAPAGAELTTSRYWRRHLREPVRFAAVFDTMREAGYTTFVEIGPHPTLLGLGQRCWPDDSATWAPSLRRDSDAWEQILAGLATLYTSGAPVDWSGFDRPYARRKLALPTYPWQQESYWSPAAHPIAPPSAAIAWPAAANAARLQADQGPLDLRVDTYETRWALLDRLAVTYIIRALRELGLFQQPGERHLVEDLIAQGRVVPIYSHLVTRWFTHLVDEGLLRQASEGGFVAEIPLPDPQVEELQALADTAFVGVEPLLAYVHRCGEQLAAVLSGQERALATLFPDGSYETVDFIYNRWAVARYFNGIAHAAVSAITQTRLNQPLRILELGAGTGGTTATLLPLLPPERTHYSFTDVSDFFLIRAAERFAAYPFVHYGLLNIEQPPQEQGYAGQSYDLVVAANVLHATSDLNATLRHVLSLVAPGGILLAYETTDHPCWLDITTGLIEGWQRFEDEWRGDHPLLTAAKWDAALRAAGFVEVLALPEAGQPTAILGQHILLARAPGEAVVAAAISSPLIDVATSGEAQLVAGSAVEAAQPPDALMEALKQALPDERRELLVDFVRRSIARVLRISDLNRLQRHQPLLDLGFDSLMAVELRNVLRQGLALPRKLPATLVFDYPSIAAIAGYLERIIMADPPVEAAVSVPVAPIAPVGADVIAELSDEEVEALLLKKLAEI